MGNTASRLIAIARAEVGYMEKETRAQLDSKTANVGDENYTKYARDLDKITGFYNGAKQGFSWCDVFVDWCFVHAFGAAKAKELLNHRECGAGCYYSMKYYREAGQLFNSPAVGDQIFFQNASGGIVHTGIVYALDDKRVYTVEGNTRPDSGVISNGGGVYEKSYFLTDQSIAGYGRPKYDPENTYIPTVLEWQKACVKDGFTFPIFGTDGLWGAECESVAKKAVVKKRTTYKYKNLTKIVQKAVGVDADGLCGSKTRDAIKAYQRKNGLSADGECGLNTWRKILGVK